MESARTFSLESLNPELKRNLLYSLERRFAACHHVLLPNDSGIQVNVGNEKAAWPEIEAFIQQFEKKAGTLGKRVQSQVLWSNKATTALKPVRGEEASQLIFKTDLPGVYMLRTELQELLQSLDSYLCRFAATLGAKTVHIPTLLSRDTLEKAGYWEREQQQIGCVVPRLNAEKAHACLSPAACLPLYPVLGESQQPLETAYTSKCGVYRWEAGVFPDHEPLSRLWEYHVRELVFFGDESYLGEVRKQYVQFVQWTCEQLNLPAEICTASDTFFHSESVNLALYQLMNETKLEFRVPFTSSPLAVSSFNFHGSHFVQAFGIAKNAPIKNSACIGFGLERLAYALHTAGCQRRHLETLQQKAADAPWGKEA